MSIICTGLLIAVVGQLLLGLNLVTAAADQVRQNYEDDEQLAVCGGLLAMDENLQDAVRTWENLGCRESQSEKADVTEVLELWRGYYPELDLGSCQQAGRLQVFLHREKNPLLMDSYPNWVVDYRWLGVGDGGNE